MLKFLTSIFKKVDESAETSKESQTYEAIPVSIASNQRKDEAVERLNFRVRGISVDDRQKRLVKLFNKYKKEVGFDFEPYDGLKAKEIKEDYYGEKVYQHSNSGFFTCIFEDEPDNEFDMNAIKVLVLDDEDEKHFVGYIPKELCSKIKELRSQYKIKIATGIVGGKFKLAKEDEEGEVKIYNGQDTYGLELHLSFWEN
ncbi:HIRAN domain-containing protein [Oceanobacillus sp. 1P07AA]|uniref:HIRAN domain-containing protein n=1 Tax=Oceanobacillus sp. 1P07AA TaxID=3132293 RepID=UPI0039A587E9